MVFVINTQMLLYANYLLKFPNAIVIIHGHQNCHRILKKQNNYYDYFDLQSIFIILKFKI